MKKPQCVKRQVYVLKQRKQCVTRQVYVLKQRKPQVCFDSLAVAN